MHSGSTKAKIMHLHLPKPQFKQVPLEGFLIGILY